MQPNGLPTPGSADVRRQELRGSMRRALGRPKDLRRASELELLASTD